VLFRHRFVNPVLARLSALVTLLALLLNAAGCAALIRGTKEDVTVATRPNHRVIYYRDSPVEDGRTITVKKSAARPAFSEAPGLPEEPMSYSIDPLILGDVALLALFIVPGAVALGVDLATGAWRNLDEQQVVFIDAGSDEMIATPESQPPSTEETGGSTLLKPGIAP
jgi:hypothetical protein